MPSPLRSLPLAAATLIAVVAAVLAVTLSAGTARGSVPAASSGTAASRGAQQCANPAAPARRDRANPLMLAHAPTDGDPLQGARFFVAGPARGQAAGAIAQLLGYARGQALESGLPLRGFTDRDRWPGFQALVNRRLKRVSPGVRRQVRLLEKIAVEPTPMRISAASGGGSPSAVYSQTRKLFCSILRADPHTIPLVSTYFLHAELGGCSTTAQIDADAPHFEAQVDAMAAAIGRRPVVLFDELDAVGSSSCMARTTHSVAAWDALVRYEALTFEKLPHTVVYLEGGYSDSNNAAYAARQLNAMGVRDTQGFFTNDTHLQWTSNELRYARAVSARTGGAHFVINTSSNGRGPLLNPHPRTEGVEDLCNPPGRGLGVPDDVDEQSLNRHLDGLLWIVPPGNSSGTCNGGPPGGVFWVARAETLAAHANLQLGPGFPSRPW